MTSDHSSLLYSHFDYCVLQIMKFLHDIKYIIFNFLCFKFIYDIKFSLTLQPAAFSIFQNDVNWVIFFQYTIIFSPPKQTS